MGPVLFWFFLIVSLIFEAKIINNNQIRIQLYMNIIWVHFYQQGTIIYLILSKQNVGFLILSTACWIFVGFLLNCPLIPMFDFFRWIKAWQNNCVFDFYVIFSTAKISWEKPPKMWNKSRNFSPATYGFCMDFLTGANAQHPWLLYGFFPVSLSDRWKVSRSARVIEAYNAFDNV